MDKNLAPGRLAEMLLAGCALAMGLVICYMAVDVIFDGQITSMFNVKQPLLRLVGTGEDYGEKPEAVGDE